MTTVGIVSSSRADFGYLSPLLKKIDSTPELHYRLIVSGSHLSDRFGNTVEHITQLGIDIDSKLAGFDGNDSPYGIAHHIGRAVTAFAEYISAKDIDLLVVFGDRYDMYPAALAALPFGLPIAHIMGGESTIGVIDEAIRHSMTKLSHLHFVSTDDHKNRVLQMGEEPWRVTNSGSLAVDAIKQTEFVGSSELLDHLGIGEGKKLGIVTFHPVTLELGHNERYVQNLLDALRSQDLEWVITYPGADLESLKIIKKIEDYVATNTHIHFMRNLGSRRYFSLMSHAEVMVGNSSSGINEAPTFKLPVVNIGSRQAGRTRADNIIDCATDTKSIVLAIARALSAEFRPSLSEMHSPFGDGTAAEIIVARLLRLEPREKLITKRFV